MTTIWITKYALTAGVQEREQIGCDGNMATVRSPGGLNGREFFHGNDWHMTKATALERAEEMRKAKIALLHKSLSKLQAMSFEND